MRWKYVLYVIFIVLIIGTSSCSEYKFTSGKLCSDPDIIGQLHDEVLPEFVLDGVYYSLPCPLSDFLDNGWEILGQPEGEVNIREKVFKQTFLLRKSNALDELTVYTDPEAETEPDNAEVVSIYYSPRSARSSIESFFVTWKGICPMTTKSNINTVISSENIGTIKDVIGYVGRPNEVPLLEYQILNEKGEEIICISCTDTDYIYLGDMKIALPEYVEWDGIRSIRIFCNSEQ